MTQKTKWSQFDLMHPLFEAMDNSKLSATQRMLLLGLYRFMDGSGVCYPSYKKLMTATGMSDRTITRNLKDLVDGGWLTYEQGEGKTHTANTYHLNLDKLGLEKSPNVVPISRDDHNSHNSTHG